MSILRCYRFLFRIALLALIATAPMLVAQDGEQIAALIRDNRIQELNTLRQENRIAAPDWRKLVDAIFETDGEAAVQPV